MAAGQSLLFFSRMNNAAAKHLNYECNINALKNIFCAEKLNKWQYIQPITAQNKITLNS